MTLGYIRMQKMFRGCWQKFCGFLSGFNRKEWKGERIMTLNREYRSHLPSQSQRARAKSVHPCCFCGGFFSWSIYTGWSSGTTSGSSLRYYSWHDLGNHLESEKGIRVACRCKAISIYHVLSLNLTLSWFWVNGCGQGHGLLPSLYYRFKSSLARVWFVGG